MVLLHVEKRLLHQARHQSVVHIFRIGRHAGHAAHAVHRSKKVDLHRVNADLRGELIPVKPAKRLCFLQYGLFAALHFLLVPSQRRQLIVRHLERIAKQRIILRGVVHREPAHL